jgi:hypothetical protein
MPLAAAAPIIGGAIGGIGSLFGANKQAEAEQQALALQQQNIGKAINYQNQQFGIEQGALQPWMTAGGQGLSNLQQLLSMPGQGLLTPFTQQFNAPTAAEAAATPGYQFQLGQGQQAIQRSAAARGGLLSGGTEKALDQYSQGLAASNYQQVYNNAMQQYLNSYNIFQGNQSNEFNRLAALSGMGLQAGGELAGLAQSAADNASRTYLGGAAMQGQTLGNLGAAQASGIVGATNALSGGINNYGQLQMLQSILGGNSGYGGGTPYYNNLSPTQISGAYGGPTQAQLETQNNTGYIS